MAICNVVHLQWGSSKTPPSPPPGVKRQIDWRVEGFWGSGDGVELKFKLCCLVVNCRKAFQECRPICLSMTTALESMGVTSPSMTITNPFICLNNMHKGLTSSLLILHTWWVTVCLGTVLICLFFLSRGAVFVSLHVIGHDWELAVLIVSGLRKAFVLVRTHKGWANLSLVQSKECFEKTAQTMKHLAKDPQSSQLLVLTGIHQPLIHWAFCFAHTFALAACSISGWTGEKTDAVMSLWLGAVQREVVWLSLGAQPCVFRPVHRNKLGNEFMLFTNYDPVNRLGGWESSKGLWWWQQQ